MYTSLVLLKNFKSDVIENILWYHTDTAVLGLIDYSSIYFIPN